MATISNSNYQAINFSDFFELIPYLPLRVLDEENVGMGFQIESVIVPNASSTSASGAITSVNPQNSDTTVWNYVGAGTNLNQSNYRFSTLNFTDAANPNHYINYSGNMTGGDGGRYSAISFKLASRISGVNADFEATYVGSIDRNSGAGALGGTVTQIIINASGKSVEIYGSFSLDINGELSGGTVTGFKFSDGTNSLTVTELLTKGTADEVLTLAEFDALTFNQLNNLQNLDGVINTNLNALFARAELTAGQTTVIPDVTTDVVNSTFTISDGIENTTMPSAQNFTVIGNALANVITGNELGNTIEGRAGNDTLNGLGGDDNLKGEEGLDVLNGGEGNDTLDGGANKDTLTGGLGDDVYVLDVGTTGKYEDKIVEAKNQGSDTLTYRNVALTAQAKALTLKLVKNFENLDVSQTGTMNFNLTGDTLNNVLTGNAGNNVLDGGKGVDTLIGGNGNDTYVLDNAGDIVVEASNEGTDQVNVKFTAGGYTLGSDIENGFVAHSKAFALTGNTLDNLLRGGSGANTLSGEDGNDTIDGGSGNDTITGGLGSDSLIGGSGNDTLNGGAGDDILNGGVGKDILIGGAGNDTILGGKSADTFIFNLADIGTAGAPSVDVVDFKIKDKDVLDLRDLLPAADEADLTGLLNFIEVTTDGTNSQIHISSTGGFTGGVYSAGAEDATITVAGLNLLAGTDESTLLQTLMTKNQLLID